MEENIYILSESEKKQIAELIKRAIGGRKGQEFAHLIGVSASTLSNLLNGKYKKRIPFDIIQKIDAYKENKNDTSLFDELYKLNGYGTENSDRPNHNIRQYAGSGQRLIANIIISSVINSGLIITERIEKRDMQERRVNPFYRFSVPDLKIKIATEEENEIFWSFIILPSNIESIESFRPQIWTYLQIASRFSSFLLYEANKNESIRTNKITFVFNEKKMFVDFIEFYNDILDLSLDVSSLLVNTERGSIVQEEFLSRSHNKSRRISLLLDNSDFDDGLIF